MVREAALLPGMCGVVRAPRPNPKPGPLVVAKRLLQLEGGVHHERPIVGHRLVHGTALKKQKMGGVVGCLELDRIYLGEHDTMARRNKLAADPERAPPVKV